MAYRSGLFNSVNGDRKYQAAHFAEYFATFIGNGVFPNPSNGLQVYAKENMTITIKPGKAWINGYYFVNDSDCDLALDISDGVLNRIDRIVLRFDTATRQIVPSVRKGAFSASPIVPTVQRDADGYEISLAQIKIVKGALTIGQGAILDERLDKTVCGIVHGTVDQVDTTTIFNQYQAWFNETTSGTETEIETWKENQYQNFADWFLTIQGILEGDVAANLTGMISTLENTIGDKNQLLTNEKTSIVRAMNELFTDVSDGKTLIANAITDKNGTASSTNTFSELASAIDSLGGGIKSVQSGVKNILASDPATIDIDINTVDLSKTIIKINYSVNITYSGSNEIRALSLGAFLFSREKIRLIRNRTPTILKVYWEVIEFEKVKSLQTGVTTIADENGSININFVDKSKAFIFFSNTATSSSKTSSHELFTMLSINTNTSLSYDQYSATEKTLYWTVIEFD